MKVLVCGGRNYAKRQYAIAYLDEFHALTPIDLLIHGGATGADTIANDWALSRGVHLARVPALWNTHGNKAGPMRNAAMLQLLPHVLIAFPGGRGTADMVSRAKAARINVWVAPE